MQHPISGVRIAKHAASAFAQFLRIRLLKIILLQFAERLDLGLDPHNHLAKLARLTSGSLIGPFLLRAKTEALNFEGDIGNPPT